MINFGKALWISDSKKKHLSQSEKKKYYKEYCHIAPAVIEGTHPPTVKSDVYAVGVLVAMICSYCKYKLLKEIAKRWLKPFSTRCSAELLTLLTNISTSVSIKT